MASLSMVPDAGIVHRCPAPHSVAATTIHRRGCSHVAMDATDQAESRSLRKCVKSLGVGVASAMLVALPRGPAQALEQRETPAPPASAPVAGSPTSQPLAFLGLKRQRTLTPPRDPSGPRQDVLDMDKLMSKKQARRYTDRDQIFSDALMTQSPLEDELQQLDEAKNERSVAKSVGTLITYGGALGGVYIAVQGLSSVERWMKQNELDDIKAEIELTGQYTSVDASDVDTAIDPTTGKNLTIVKKQPQPSANATSTAAAEPAQTPWLLRVLGLGGAADADSDDFWAGPAQTVRKDSKPDGKGPGGDPTASDSTSTDGTGEGGADDASDGDEDEGMEDDTSGVDTLDDLLG